MQLPDEIRKCAVFIGHKSPKGNVYWGTAFWVSLDLKNLGMPGSKMPFLVTSTHVLGDIRNASGGPMIIRVNGRNQDSIEIEKHCDEWLPHPTDSSVDISVIRLGEGLDKTDIIGWPIESLVDSESIKKAQIGIGDDLFIVGLFYGHEGTAKNLPIIRIGNIAAMPEERVNSPLGEVEAYLIEARSSGGISGSPVFVCLNAGRRIADSAFGLAETQYRLLGLVQSHFDFDPPSAESPGGRKKKASRDIDRINAGIAVVIPATKILETMEQPKIMNAIRNVIENERRNKSAMLD